MVAQQLFLIAAFITVVHVATAQLIHFAYQSAKGIRSHIVFIHNNEVKHIQMKKMALWFLIMVQQSWPITLIIKWSSLTELPLQLCITQAWI